MKVTITISTDRISRELNKSEELAAILRDIADKFRWNKVPDSDTIHDCKTKTVGTLRITNLTKAEKEISKKAKMESEMESNDDN